MAFNKNIYQFYLRKDASTYYYVNAGAVFTSSTPKELGSVADWDKVQLLWKRNTTYLGVFRTQAPDQVQFVGDAAIILRYIFNTQQSEGICELVINKLKTTDLQYYLLGAFSIDFSRALNHVTDFVVGLMEGGLSALLKAYESTPFSIPIGADDPKNIWVQMDGVNLLGTYHFITGDGMPSTSRQDRTHWLLPLAATEEEGDYNVGDAEVQIHEVDNPIGSAAATNFAFKTLLPFTGHIDFNLNITFSNHSAGVPVRLGVLATIARAGDFSGAGLLDLATSTLYGAQNVSWTDGVELLGGNSRTVNAVFTLDYDFAVGDCLFVEVFAHSELLPGTDDFCDIAVASGGSMAVRYNYLLPTTVCQGFRQWDVFRKLTVAMTNGAYVAQSDFFSDTAVTDTKIQNGYGIYPHTTIFTCGDALRNLTLDNNGDPSSPTIQTTMKDFQKDAFVGLNTGMGIEKNILGDDVLVIEKLTHFYQKDVLIADLGEEISNVEISPYVDNLGNTLEVGYEDQTYDEVNGRLEPNSTQTYKLPITRVLADIDYKSPYRADPYGIEYTRANLANKLTTDSSSDNDTFKLHVLNTAFGDTGGRLLDRTITVSAGLPAEVEDSARIFNLGFTPKRCFRRIESWLKSNLTGFVNKLIAFQTAAKNKDLVTYLTPTTITESSDVDLDAITTIEPLLFIPIVFTFDTQVPLDLADLMATNPYGVFGFTYKGVYLEGFVLEAGITPGTNATYNFKLLLSPNTPIPDYL